MKRSPALLNALWLLSIPAALALGQTSKNQQAFIIDAVKAPYELPLTGTLSDPAWVSAPEVECRYEIEPDENTPARQRTRVKVLYTERSLYIGFICLDSDPSAIRAHISDRDNNFDDDWVFVGIDPFRTNQRGYEFVVNPYGIQGDLMITSSNEDPSWDAVWEAKAALNDSGYTVEMAIPFKSLHFPSTPVQDWSVMLLRTLPRASRYQNSWTPVDKNDPCIICQAGTLRGLAGLQSTELVELLPYAMGFQTGALRDGEDPASGFVDNKVQGRAGIGLKYAPGPDLSLEAVVNPDFSQVESDATEISINSTFAIFYPEKRPFFLDGADLFKTQISTFNSRMINNPLAAGKVIHSADQLTLAYLGAEDRNTPYIIPGEEGSSSIASSVHSFSNVLRGRYTFGRQSYVGFLGTTRNSAGAHNYTGGIDWSLFFGDNYTRRAPGPTPQRTHLPYTTLFADAQHYGGSTVTRGFDGEAFSGTALTAEFRRDARTYNFQVTYRDAAPTFQAQNGSVTAIDQRMVSVENALSFYPAGAVLDRWSLFADAGLHFNHAGERKERWGIVGGTVHMKGQTQMQVMYFLANEERFHGVLFPRINRVEMELSASPLSALGISADLELGRFIHRTDDPSLGTGHNASLTVRLKLASQLSISLTYARARLSDVATRELFYDGYIGRCQAIYHFSGDLFVRLIGQYDQFGRAIEIDPLISYKLNPFTIFYVGSTHTMADFGDPFGIRQTARQYFLKLQYLWRQ